jgi:hypothetical protein
MNRLGTLFSFALLMLGLLTHCGEPTTQSADQSSTSYYGHSLDAVASGGSSTAASGLSAACQSALQADSPILQTGIQKCAEDANGNVIDPANLTSQERSCLNGYSQQFIAAVGSSCVPPAPSTSSSSSN